MHFQEAEQGFCDEVFRRIDGPFSLNELSALLRAADVANSTHRNFRYCRATEVGVCAFSPCLSLFILSIPFVAVHVLLLLDSLLLFVPAASVVGASVASRS